MQNSVVFQFISFQGYKKIERSGNNEKTNKKNDVLSIKSKIYSEKRGITRNGETIVKLLSSSVIVQRNNRETMFDEKMFCKLLREK